jgi:bifunctional enzyme CysN/CysC/sulfate adenylyltransferase subunit 1
MLRLELVHRGQRAVVIDDEFIPESALAGAVRALQLAGVTAISARKGLLAETIESLRQIAGDDFEEGE